MPWTLMEAAWWVGRKHDRTNYLNLYLPPDQCTIPLDRGGYCGPVFVLRPFHRTFYATLEYNTRATPLAGPTGRPCPPRLGNRLGTAGRSCRVYIRDRIAHLRHSLTFVGVYVLFETTRPRNCPHTTLSPSPRDEAARHEKQHPLFSHLSPYILTSSPV